MNIFNRVLLLLAVNVWWLSTAQSQALDQIGIKKGIKINGSLSANTVLYAASGMPLRRDPFNWFLQGNFNVNLFGYNAPFSFSYSNQGRNFSQPFNRFQFAPSYKWAKAYLGTTSMTFSNYTLAGHLFEGAGVELSPGKWRVAAMYGRLLKAISFDFNNKESYSRAAFERRCMALKTGYENNGNSYTISIFKAKDNPHSLSFIPADATLNPQENLAVGIAIKQTLWKRIFTDIEYSVSALNRDIRTEKNNTDSSIGRFNFLKNWLSPSQSTAYFDALQAGLGYTGNAYSIQLRYERVAPGYITLGAYNIINDMRNITIAPAAQLFRGKLNLAANVGVQDNNLDNAKSSTTRRWVGSGNMNFILNDHWLFNTAYSNFSTFTKVRPFADPYFNNPLDSLNFYQVNTTYNGTISYRFGSKEIKHAVVTNLSYQKASDEQQQSQNSQQQISSFYTGNISYNYNQMQTGLSLTAGGNYYVQEAPGTRTKFIGPSITASRFLLNKKLRLNASSAYNITQATANGNNTKSNLWNASMQAVFTPQATEFPAAKQGKKKRIEGKHSVTASLNFLRQSAMTNRPAFQEWTTIIGYRWNF